MPSLRVSRVGKSGAIGRLLIHCLSIVALSVVLGAATYLFNPRVASYASGGMEEGEIRLSQIPSDAHVLWVDARSRSEYELVHAPGAVLLNEESFNSLIGGFFSRWQPGDLVIVYCSKETCSSSRTIARRLRDEVGVENARHLQGGWEALERFGRFEAGSAINGNSGGAK